MREETQQQDTCVCCGQPITSQQHPCKGLPDGRKAHLDCYLDRADEEPDNPGH